MLTTGTTARRARRPQAVQPNGRHWVGDLHLGHHLVADQRGFASVQEHDDYVIGQLMSIHPEGLVWVLGDISSGKADDEQRALALLSQVPATLHLIAGNHDSVSSTNRNGFKHQREFLETFASVQQFTRVRINATDVMMMHYPYERSGDGPNRSDRQGRYLEYRLPDRGMPLIHAHTHHTGPHMPDPRFGPDSDGIRLDLDQICVSWDAHRGPVSESQMNDWLVLRQEALQA